MAAVRSIAYLKSPNTDAILARTGFLDEHRLLAPHFAERGYRLEAVDWQDASVDWERYAFVVPKNVWDYHSHYPRFLAWLTEQERAGQVLRNSAALIHWNTDKQYLLEMQARGANVAPLTLLRTDADLARLPDILAQNQQTLLKPAVSGGGKQTWLYDSTQLTEARTAARQILRDCAVVVQPFLKEVAGGEWSYFFFGGEYSHAIRKIPKAGDFRAHSNFGATNAKVAPEPAQIAEAQSFLAALPSAPHYARVDGIYSAGKLMLIEMELIEPYLYFEHGDAGSPVAFVEALLRNSP